MIKRQLFKGGVLSLISGVALWLPFHNSQFFFLAWVALIPFLFFLVSKPEEELTPSARMLRDWIISEASQITDEPS